MPDSDPTLPSRMPLAIERAIRSVKSWRSWGPVDMYRAVRDAAREPHEFVSPPDGPSVGHRTPHPDGATIRSKRDQGEQ
ncbi:MAG: hypothetical protein AAGH68_02255 [Pseudomonadota bacterium]